MCFAKDPEKRRWTGLGYGKKNTFIPEEENLGRVCTGAHSREVSLAEFIS